jgi:hypothetical protein
LVLAVCAALLVSAGGMLSRPGRATAVSPERKGRESMRPQHEADPLPIRRLLVEPKQVPARLRGALKKLSRDEFEARVKAAGRAAAALRNPPRLLSAHYRATLKGLSLDGKGDWTLTNAHAAGILPLPDLNLALANVKLRSADAVLGDLDGKTLGLLVKNPGKHSAVFDWTARGDPLSDGLHFKLRVPACAVASLELTLPADRLVRLAQRSQGVVSRLPPEKDEDIHWHIRFSGRSELHLVIYRTTGPNPPLVLSRLQTEQTLTPGRVEARFKFQLEVLHNIARKLYLECDPALTPDSVAIPQVDHRWKLDKGARPGAPRVLVVELREPVLGPLAPLTVGCRGTALAGKPWVSPGLRLVKVLPWGKSTADEEDRSDPLADPRLVGAESRGEELTLLVHPDVSVQRWHAGTFRLIPPGKTEGQPKGYQVLTLVGEGESAAGRPSFFIMRPAVSALQASPLTGCLARQLSWWQVGARESRLTVQLAYQIARGRLFQLHLGVMPGWEVEDVKPGPGSGDLVRTWAPVEDKGRRVLLIELQRALTPEVTARLTAVLRAPHARAAAAAGRTLPFPDVEPLDAEYRTGGLAVSVTPLYQARVSGASALATAPPEGRRQKAEGRTILPSAFCLLPSEEVPWGGRTPDYYFPFRLRRADAAATLRPAVTGRLRLRPRPARVRVRCVTEVVLAPEGASGVLRLHLRPVAGRAEAIDLYLSAPLSRPGNWQTERGRNRVRQAVPLLPPLLGLGAGSPLGAAGTLGGCGRGQWWRLTLARPLEEPLTVQTPFPVTPPRDRRPGEAPWRVPLATVPAADGCRGEVTLYLAGGERALVQTRGLREVAAGPRTSEPAGGAPEAAALWRSYRYGPAWSSGGEPGAGPELSVRRQARAAEPSPEEVIDRSRLTTAVEPHGRLLHHFAFRVWRWRQRTLAVRLPAQTRPLAVKAYGRWIKPLPRAAAGGVVLDLSVASGQAVHDFEILYASYPASAAWQFWSRAEAPVPSLPLRPLSFRRIWLLPPGLEPLTRGGLRRLPGPGGKGGWTGTDLFGRLHSSGEAQATSRQRQLLAQAAVRLRRPPVGEKPWRLGDLVRRLAFDHLRDQVVLVLDVDALRAAGLTPESPPSLPPAPPDGEPTPPWQEWGLVYVPSRGAALLTTRRQREAWQPGASGPVLSPSLEEAVSEAAVYGRDRSGRFLSGLDWLREPGIRGQGTGISQELTPDPWPLTPDSWWTAWEPVAGLEGDEVLWTVRERALPVLGLGLARALVAAAWVLRRRLSPGWRFRLLLGWLAGFGLALYWLPPALGELAWWPALAGLTWAVVWYVWSTAARQLGVPAAAAPGKSGVSTAGQAAAGVLALLCGAELAGRAAAPAPYTVLLVHESADRPDKLTALVPAELLQRLDGLAGRGAAGLRGAVLLSAEYKSKVEGGKVILDADFQVYCFGKEATLTVPLGNAVLKPRGGPLAAAFFAGEPAFPVALPRGQKGFRLALQAPEPGAYLLSLRLQAAVSVSGEDRDFQLTIPPLAQSRLTLRLPRQASDIYEESGLGAQQVSEAEPKARLLKADLGRVGELRVRWRQPDGQPRRAAAQVQVQETYLWDLRNPDLRLSGVLHYTVKGGIVSSLTVGMAEGLEVRSVEVLPWPAGRAAAPRQLNKSWRLEGRLNQRRLRVDLYRPVTGSLQLLLELVPRLPARPGLLPLPMPRPLGARVLKGALAYRLEGMKARDVPQHLGTATMKLEVFAQNWRRAVRTVKDTGLPTQAFSFVRLGEPAAFGLLLSPPAPEARQTVRWRVGPRFADLEEATLKLTAPTAGLMLVEWDVPGVQVTGVTGPQVRSWSRSDSRVQVWLQGPCPKAELRLTGWAALPPPGPDRRRRLALPCLRPVGVASPETEVLVAAGAGRALEPVRLRNLTPVPESPSFGTPPPGTFLYQTQQPFYESVFTLDAPRAEVRGLTLARVQDGQVVVRAWLDYEVTRGELRTVRVRLRRWFGDEVRLEAPGAVQEADRQPGRDPYLWTLTLPPGSGKLFTVRLTGRVSLEAAPSFLMPEVRDVSGSTVQTRQRWLAVSGGEIQAEDVRGLAAVGDPERGVRLRSPAARQALGRLDRAWRVQSPDWQLRLRPRPPARAPGVRLFLAEQTATVGDGRHWVHEGVYWLFADNGTDLRLDMPAGASVLGVSVDGLREVPRHTRPGEVWLSLPGGAGVHTACVRWTYRAGEETLDRPRLDRLRLASAAGPLEQPPLVLTLYVPPGYQPLAPDRAGEKRPALDLARQDLERAAAQGQLSKLLAPRAQDRPGGSFAAQLQAAQERFFWYCRQAEYRLALAARAAHDPDQALQSLRDRHRTLLRENADLLRSPSLEKIRARAEASARDLIGPPATVAGADQALDVGPGRAGGGVEFPVCGLPTYWQVKAADGPPRLRLRSERWQSYQRAWAASSLVVAGLLAGWILSLFPRLFSWIQMAWPEQILLMGLLLWEVFGLSLAGLGVMVLGAGARLLLFVMWGLGHLYPAAAARPGAVSTSSS